MSDKLLELAEDVLAQTWSGFSEIPVGPSISSTFQRAVRDGKFLARGVQHLEQLRAEWHHACNEEQERAELAERRIQALEAAIEHVVSDSPGTPDSVKGFLRTAVAAAAEPSGEVSEPAGEAGSPSITATQPRDSRGGTRPEASDTSSGSLTSPAGPSGSAE